MKVPGSWRGVRNQLQDAPGDVQAHFAPAEELIERYPLAVSLSYMFSRLEQAHLMALYCGVVKLHRVDKELARAAIDRFENRPTDFRALFQNVFGEGLPKALIKTLQDAQDVRNNYVHGKSVNNRDFRKALVAMIEYATRFNNKCDELGEFRPFGRLQGFKGAGASLDKSTSRWVLKGIGLPLD